MNTQEDHVPLTTPDFFLRCGVALFGHGPGWKTQLCREFGIKTESIDAMVAGRSRVPPGVWRDIAKLFEDREKIYPILRAATLELKDIPDEMRTYQFPGGFEMPVFPRDDGSFPVVEYTEGTAGDWQAGPWLPLANDKRVLPENALGYRFAWGEEKSQAFLIRK